MQSEIAARQAVGDKYLAPVHRHCGRCRVYERIAYGSFISPSLRTFAILIADGSRSASKGRKCPATSVLLIVGEIFGQIKRRTRRWRTPAAHQYRNRTISIPLEVATRYPLALCRQDNQSHVQSIYCPFKFLSGVGNALKVRSRDLTCGCCLHRRAILRVVDQKRKHRTPACLSAKSDLNCDE